MRFLLQETPESFSSDLIACYRITNNGEYLLAKKAWLWEKRLYFHRPSHRYNSNFTSQAALPQDPPHFTWILSRRAFVRTSAGTRATTTRFLFSFLPFPHSSLCLQAEHIPCSFYSHYLQNCDFSDVGTLHMFPCSYHHYGSKQVTTTSIPSLTTSIFMFSSWSQPLAMFSLNHSSWSQPLSMFSLNHSSWSQSLSTFSLNHSCWSQPLSTFSFNHSSWSQPLSMFSLNHSSCSHPLFVFSLNLSSSSHPLSTFSLNLSSSLQPLSIFSLTISATPHSVRS